MGEGPNPRSNAHRNVMGVTKKVEKKAEGAKNPIAVLVRRAGAIIGSEAWFFNIDILEVCIGRGDDAIPALSACQSQELTHLLPTGSLRGCTVHFGCRRLAVYWWSFIIKGSTKGRGGCLQLGLSTLLLCRNSLEDWHIILPTWLFKNHGVLRMLIEAVEPALLRELPNQSHELEWGRI